MAYLWRFMNDEKWTPTELHSAAVLRGGSVDFIAEVHAASLRSEVLLYPSSANTRSATWMLLAPSDSVVRINDALLESGIRVVTDHDAIRVADFPTVYFSTERLAEVVPFPAEEDVYCPRDKVLIAEGDPSVCCPQCGVWHHEQAAEGRACWSYAETCALCDQSTELGSARFRWTPEEL